MPILYSAAKRVPWMKVWAAAVWLAANVGCGGRLQSLTPNPTRWSPDSIRRKATLPR
jgi:hypothetical protein